MKFIGVIAAVAAPLGLALMSTTDDYKGATLESVLDKGYLTCGTFASVPLLGVTNEDGTREGFEIDLCTAVATALGIDVQFVDADSTTRFTFLDDGTADIVCRGSTNTLTRRNDLGKHFAPTTLFDGQGFIRLTGSSATPTDGSSTICVNGGGDTPETWTTTLINLMSYAVEGNQIMSMEDDMAFSNVLNGEGCDLYTTDKSALAARQSAIDDPRSMEILTDTISKEPLACLSAGPDDMMNMVLDAVINGLIVAEEHGITQDNVAEYCSDPSQLDAPEAQRLVGADGFLGGLPGEALSSTFMCEVISKVGNYAEIYERNLGSVITRDGTQNAQYGEGGLLYGNPWA
uniref:Solute-binding protein family 3/N-terminal domain-containing protein n=1 Tax=Fibrocapsa japonica TaxID=94617 RepID=A0A7S2Y1C5_9STRA|mmetsp:Transcript_8012/g.12249  ORF Transcript_8012/g.12249 Transcript_8012/m.12249 type:complete len:346 (+) Transcript_8012:92-1129(+)